MDTSQKMVKFEEPGNLKNKLSSLALRKMCPYSEFFWPVFYRIRTEYGEILSLRIYSECEKMWTRKTPNTDTFHEV